MKLEVPVLLANVAQNYFVNTFKEQGWDGQPWQEVKRRVEGTKEYKYPKYKDLSRRTSPILVRTGGLRRAVSNSIRSATWQSIRLVVDYPGAANQNEGLTLPRRHFMGQSKVLDELIKSKLKQNIDKAWQH